MYTKEYLLSTNYFENNEYFEKYYDLIQNNINSEYIKFETNKHHILPRHFFKEKQIPIDNSIDNLVYLYFKDHMLAHLYLSGCTKGRNKYWNLYSIYHMSGKDLNKSDLKYIENLDFYQYLYQQAIEAAPNHRKGLKVSTETRERMKKAQQKRVVEKGPTTKGTIWIHNEVEEKMINKNEIDFYLEKGYITGRLYKHSEETKNKIGMYSKNREITDSFREKMSKIASNQKRTPEQLKKLSDSLKKHYENHSNHFKGKHHTIESKKKMSDANKGRKWMHKDDLTKYVKSSEVEYYLSIGFSFGRKN